MISPGLGSIPAVIASELVPGALAPVKWEVEFVGSYNPTKEHTIFWRALPTSSDYLAVGCVASMVPANSSIPSQPPANIAARFRAVHKRALTAPAKDLTPLYHYYSDTVTQNVVFGVDGRYIQANTTIPNKADCYILDPKNTVEEFSFNT